MAHLKKTSCQICSFDLIKLLNLVVNYRILAPAFRARFFKSEFSPLLSGVEISAMQMHSAIADSATANPRMNLPTKRSPNDDAVDISCQRTSPVIIRNVDQKLLEVLNTHGWLCCVISRVAQLNEQETHASLRCFFLYYVPGCYGFMSPFYIY